MDKVSIIVPIYNVEKYVAKCLDSLCKQTYKNIEILAIIDGSPDNSISIVKEYSKKDSRIKCIEKENGGYGSVLEYAIKIIDTEYFIICDPDDWLENNCIERLVSIANETKSDIVIGNKYLVYDNGDQVEDKIESKYYEVVENKVYDDNIEMFSFFPPSPHSKLYRTELAKRIIFPHKVSFTDFVLYMVCLKNSKRITITREPLSYYYLERPGNTRMDKKPKAISDHIVVWNSIYEQINPKINKVLLTRLYKEFKYITKIYYRNSKSFLKDDIFNELLGIQNKLKQHKNEIKKLFVKGVIDYMEMKFLLGGLNSLKIYISLRKVFNK